MKTFILSTHCLLKSADSLLRFDGDNQIVIPFPVIDELEKFSKKFSEEGKIAREILSYIDSFNIKDLLSIGVRQKNGSLLSLNDDFKDESIDYSDLPFLHLRYLQIAKGLKKTSRGKVIFLSQNTALRIKAKKLGICAEGFRDDIFPSLKEQYSAREFGIVTLNSINDFNEKGFLNPKKLLNYKDINFYPNMFIIFKDIDNSIPIDDVYHSVIGRFDGKNIVKLNYNNYHPYQITAKNIGQVMLIESLMASPKDAPIVIVKGNAGTGKTFVTLAVALEKTTEENNIYSQILITAPTETIGQMNLGFLPGEIENKFNPHIGGIKDNIHILLNHSNKAKGKNVEDGSFFFERNLIQIQPIGFLRGRTIVDNIFIIDETQNIHPHDIKSIVTRAGKGSKFIFLGDPTQIDNPELNETFNGLVYLSEKMKDDPGVWQVSLTEGESVRSDISRRAAIIL